MQQLPDAGARWQRVRLAMIAENAKLPTTEAYSPARPGEPTQPPANGQQDDDQTPPNDAA